MTTKPTASEYLARSRAKLAAKGGRIIQVRLRPAEVEALAKYKQKMGYETDSDAIRAMIMTSHLFPSWEEVAAAILPQEKKRVK